MSYEKSNRDDENKSRKTRSNYFQTEFSITFNKKKEEKSCSSSSSQSVPEEKFEGNHQLQVKKKNISVQVGRNIIGQEKMPKERKKWIRPPLVGQASTSTDVVIPAHQELASDSDEEIIESSHPTIEPTNFTSRNDYRNRKDYISEKPPEGGTVEAEISPITNQSDYGKSAASPTSSVTSSRPLEWDSGADVGYYQFYSGQGNDAELSTLERLALQRGSASLLTRSDPEGTTCSSVKPNTAPVGRPTAESTPVNTLSRKKENTSAERGNYPLFPEVIIKEHQVSDSDIETNRSAESAVKKSNSLEVVSKMKSEERPATFPRSQSQTNVVFNINPQLQKILANTKSNSSSSVATVVTGRKKVTNNSPESGVSAGDRANSFEYLPGHIYENKSNEVPVVDGQHFKDDIERGVQLLTDFVKGSNANNTLLRKELLQRVVEGLISAEYLSDREWSPILKRCVTRRSQNRDISGESSTIDDHHSRRIYKESSSGPSPAPSNHTSYVSSHNTTSETSKTSDSLFRVNAHKKEIQKLSNHEEAVNLPKYKTHGKSPDSSKTSSSDWKQPFTKSEKFFEAKKVADVNAPIDGKLLQYLHSERANQIDWIKKEINHLSNLKSLLEKHENLRKNFAILKKKKQRALSADAVKSSRPNKKMKEVTKTLKSEPVVGFQREARGRFENDGSMESDYNSHNYDTDRGDGIIRRNASTDTRSLKIVQGWEAPEKKKSLAYTIIFEPEKEKENIDHEDIKGEQFFEEKPVVDRETLMKMSRHKIKEQFSKMSLQNELLSKRPDYVARAEGRRQIVAELTALRELRQQHKINVLAAAVSDSTQPIPPPPLAVKRVVSQHQMRSLTEKKYKQTFEVQQKKQDLKRKEDYRTNRLMAEVFKKKLQKRTLKGETDLSNSIHVISPS